MTISSYVYCLSSRAKLIIIKKKPKTISNVNSKLIIIIKKKPSVPLCDPVVLKVESVLDAMVKE